MKACLLIPKDAPHLCMHADGGVTDFSYVVFREILPSDDPWRCEQEWVVDGSQIRLAKNPNMVLSWHPDWGVVLFDQNRVGLFSIQGWKKIGDKIMFAEWHSERHAGLGAPEGINEGHFVMVGKTGEMYGFEFRDVKWDDDEDLPKESNSQDNKVDTTVEPKTKPDLPSIASITADLSLLFGTDGSGQAGTCSTEISLVKGYIGKSTSTSIPDKLHKELCVAATNEGSILARKVKERCTRNVAMMVGKSVRIPRREQEMKFQLNIDLGSPCFIYQMCYEAVLTDGTIVEYYGGHFITGDVIDLDDDDDASNDSPGECTAARKAVTGETKVEPNTSGTIDEEKSDGGFFADNAVERKDSSEESNSDSSEWEGVVVE